MVADGFGQRDGLLAHGPAGRLVEKGRGRFLDDLLVSPLDRAFALAEIEHGAVLVAEHLDLDMARLRHELLDEDAVVAERAFRLVLRGLEALARLRVVPGDAHALAAAAGRRLDHDRIADFAGDLHRLVRIRDQAHMAGHGGYPGLGGELLRGDLVAHRLDRVDRRADEGDARRLQRFGEGGVLRQEAVARMHRIRAGLDCVDDLVDHDIGLAEGAGPICTASSAISLMQRIGIRIGIDCDRL